MLSPLPNLQGSLVPTDISNMDIPELMPSYLVRQHPGQTLNIKIPIQENTVLFLTSTVPTKQ
jgi:hypothetical protein